MSKLRLSRIQYGFALGILLAVWIHFPTPRAFFALAIAGTLTALRFNALGWKPWKAMIPVMIASTGTMLAMIVGIDASKEVAHLWRGAAILTQFGMTASATFAWEECDPKSPKTALWLDTFKKRRKLIALGREAEPIQAKRERAFAAMLALHEELRSYGQLRGFAPSPEHDAIRRRMDAQQQAVDHIRAIETEHNEKRRIAAESLREATEALKGYRRTA